MKFYFFTFFSNFFPSRTKISVSMSLPTHEMSHSSHFSAVLVNIKRLSYPDEFRASKEYSYVLYISDCLLNEQNLDCFLVCNGNSFLLFNFFYFFRLSFSLHKWQPLAALWSIFSQIVIANIFVLSKVAKFFKVSYLFTTKTPKKFFQYNKNIHYHALYHPNNKHHKRTSYRYIFSSLYSNWFILIFS